MIENIIVPQIGMAASSARIDTWLVESGDYVEKNQEVLLLETEKSVQEIVSPESGVLNILISAGGVCEVGQIVGEIEVRERGV